MQLHLFHAEGELVYAGPAAEVLPYFEKLGHKCPEHFNPAGALLVCCAQPSCG